MFSRNAFSKVRVLGLGPRSSVFAPSSFRALGTVSSSRRQELVSHLEPSSLARPPPASNSVLYADSLPIDAKEQVMDGIYCKIADRYETVLEIMSLGMNQMWKRRFVHLMKPAAGQKMLDVAGGTGQIARNYLKYQDSRNKDTTSSVHVVDLNEQMLRVGRHRLAGSQWVKDRRISFAHGNAESLKGIADNSFDIYSISAGMHNIPRPERALSEAFRVLKPGGLFACLEYGHVDTPVIKQFNRWHLDTLVPALGQLLVNDRASYERLARSARAFPHQKDFAKAIGRAGFVMLPDNEKGYTLMQCGMMVAYFGTKPE
ncbi:hypothetical protein IWW38_003353 [Coemansia aciculifera]|uniref:Uncharacterized protein n=1 Tax=Coemansia aciculifera TaxID=417176 RepID=A0ACC1M0W7_9FUNG|nr:hypothetical protein IWW38_003353 [Coemansia aciculifera]